MKYTHLFSEGRIGQLTIKNRIFMTAAGCHLTETDGTITEELLAYYDERAKGGVGAIITEVVRVDEETGVMNEHQIQATNNRHIMEIKKLADRLHVHGCKLFLQLQHPGNVTHPGNINGRIPVSASGLPSLLFDQKVEELTVEGIKDIVGKFGDAAKRCMLAGADGIEIHGAHFYLVHQFLTPLFNKRTDEYGGCHENRMRFLKEIIEDIKAKCGEFPILVRISAEDYMGDEGYHLNEGIKICQDVESYGAAAIDVTCAGTGCRGGQSLEPVSYRQGWRKHLATAVKKMVDIPVISVALIRDPEYAEGILRENRFDFIGSARCHLADPEWSNKSRDGREDEIRKCISCLKCIDGIKNGQSVSCSVNPRCGREAISGDLQKDGNGRTVVVIGGGPAGMEAAKNASLRGFKTVLMEKNNYFGGQVYLAAQAPNKDKMFWYTNYMKKQLELLKVDVQLGKKADIDEIKALNPFAVIDATGATPIVPNPFKGREGFVFTPDEVLSGKVKIENESIIIVGSGMTGLETAEFLVEKNNSITLIEMDSTVARLAYPTQVSDILPVLEKASTVVMTSTSLDSIGEGFITIKNVNTGEISTLVADKVILSLGVRSQNGLKEKLRMEFENVHIAGDSLKGGRIIDAVQSGYDIAARL